MSDKVRNDGYTGPKVPLSKGYTGPQSSTVPLQEGYKGPVGSSTPGQVSQTPSSAIPPPAKNVE